MRAFLLVLFATCCSTSVAAQVLEAEDDRNVVTPGGGYVNADWFRERGRPFDAAEAHELRIGKTNVAEVVRLLGSPERREIRDGQRWLVYEYIEERGRLESWSGRMHVYDLAEAGERLSVRMEPNDVSVDIVVDWILEEWFPGQAFQQTASVSGTSPVQWRQPRSGPPSSGSKEEVEAETNARLDAAGVTDSAVRSRLMARALEAAGFSDEPAGGVEEAEDPFEEAE
jgi:hypothetical protein